MDGACVMCHTYTHRAGVCHAAAGSEAALLHNSLVLARVCCSRCSHPSSLSLLADALAGGELLLVMLDTSLLLPNASCLIQADSFLQQVTEGDSRTPHQAARIKQHTSKRPGHFLHTDCRHTCSLCAHMYPSAPPLPRPYPSSCCRSC